MNEDEISALAARLHAGQVDKGGGVYHGHLERAARYLKQRWPDATPDEIAAAWLHDAIEDTEATAASLLAAGISPETVRIVQAMTRPEEKPYLDYVRQIADSGDRSVIRVKLADNHDNRDPRRVATLADGAERVARRYEPARQLLEAALARMEGGGH
jgi:(p)ppGpp synthase/HD superfamily hydrolase